MEGDLNGSKGIRLEVLDWIHLAQNIVWWRALMNFELSCVIKGGAFIH
jgi:hypothetical protein